MRLRSWHSRAPREAIIDSKVYIRLDEAARRVGRSAQWMRQRMTYHNTHIRLKRVDDVLFIAETELAELEEELRHSSQKQRAVTILKSDKERFYRVGSVAYAQMQRISLPTLRRARLALGMPSHRERARKLAIALYNESHFTANGCAIKKALREQHGMNIGIESINGWIREWQKENMIRSEWMSAQEIATLTKCRREEVSALYKDVEHMRWQNRVMVYRRSQVMDIIQRRRTRDQGETALREDLLKRPELLNVDVGALATRYGLTPREVTEITFEAMIAHIGADEG